MKTNNPKVKVISVEEAGKMDKNKPLYWLATYDKLIKKSKIIKILSYYSDSISQKESEIFVYREGVKHGELRHRDGIHARRRKHFHACRLKFLYRNSVKPGARHLNKFQGGELSVIVKEKKPVTNHPLYFFGGNGKVCPFVLHKDGGKAERFYLFFVRGRIFPRAGYKQRRLFPLFNAKAHFSFSFNPLICPKVRLV